MCWLKSFDGRMFPNSLGLVECIEENQHLFFVYLFIDFPGPFEVYDVAPWTNTHLQMRKFSDRLKDLEELVYLYPQIDKNDAFGQYYTNDGKDTPVYSAHNPTKWQDTSGWRGVWKPLLVSRKLSYFITFLIFIE